MPRAVRISPPPHDSGRHDDHNDDRHHEHANQDTQVTVDNDSLQHLAEVQGVDASRCKRKLTVATFVSECGDIRLRTGLVEHNRSLASFSADDARRVL